MDLVPGREGERLALAEVQLHLDGAAVAGRVELDPHRRADRHEPVDARREAARDRRAVDLDPLSPLLNTVLGRHFYLQNELDLAIQQYRKALQLNPNFGLTRMRLGEAYLRKGLTKEALAELQKARTLYGQDPVGIGQLGHAYALSGEKGRAMAFTEISNRSGRFVDGKGHYIYAYDYNGTLLAHPYLPEKIGTSLMDHRDPFGMESIRALSDTARAGGGYIVFIWPNPDKGNQEELKIGYVLPVDDTWWVGSGVYLSEITGQDSSFPSTIP